MSQVTKLSVAKVVSFMMAVWFLASSIAQFVGGRIAGLMGTETVRGPVLDAAAARAPSLEDANERGWGGVPGGVVLVPASFAIKGWAQGVDTPQHDPEEPL